MTQEPTQKPEQTKLIADLAAQIAAQKGIADLAAAYVTSMGEIENVTKNANNPHFGSNYADLSAVLDTIKPVFARNGLALLQSPGEMEGDKITLVWILMHRSGQTIQGRTQLPIGAKSTAQAAGSAITYARRYQGAAIGGIAQVDDDGNAASARDDKPRKGTPKPEKESSGGASYDDTAEALIAKILECKTVPDVEALKTQVAELGDQKVAETYVAHKKSLKEAAKGAK